MKREMPILETILIKLHLHSKISLPKKTHVPLLLFTTDKLAQLVSKITGLY